MNKNNQVLRDQIKNYIIKNPIDRNKPNCYKAVADKFGVHSEYIRSIHRAIRESISDQVTPTNSKLLAKVKHEIDGVTIEKAVNEEVRNIDDLIEKCQIDTKNYEVSTWECSKWNVASKDEETGELGKKELYAVRAKLQRRTPDTDLNAQKEYLLNEIKKSSPINKLELDPGFFGRQVTDSVLEISIPDLHIGKFSWGKETGEDYDIKIACQRYTDAVEELLSRANLSTVDRILLPVGNDMINVDNKFGTTTMGTPQSTDSRFGKMFQAAKKLLINTIDRLSTIAPVDVVVISGNHDSVTMFTLGEVLDAWYHNSELVNVDNSPKARKYYQYGKNGLMFTHGNEEKHSELGLIFATEEPKLWAATEFREVHLGHFHKVKRTSFVSVDEFQGFKVRILPSLSGTDSWHYSKGYNSKKGAQAFVYHRTKGLIAEYNYNI